MHGDAKSANEPRPQHRDAPAVAGTSLRDTTEVSSADTGVPAQPAFDARRAFGYLMQICRIGNRASGSPGMVKQQKLIVEHFSQFPVKVSYQNFDVPHPLSGRPVRMTNIIVSWHPQARERVLIACHYDTRPFPDADRANPRGLFVGANDGASGVALLMELAHHMADLKPTYGVDFVFFDGEELIFRTEERLFGRDGYAGEYFLGSKHFAKTYRDDPQRPYRYVCGVLVDMVGDRRLNLYMERKSLHYAPEVTRSLWATARELGIREFIPRRKHDIDDDHVPLNEIAGIPTCDIIDFDYPYWHTTRDLPSQCSGESLAKVGRVLLVWLTRVPAVNKAR